MGRSVRMVSGASRLQRKGSGLRLRKAATEVAAFHNGPFLMESFRPQTLESADALPPLPFTGILAGGIRQGSRR
jgi:hypothetical protein